MSKEQEICQCKPQGKWHKNCNSKNCECPCHAFADISQRY